MLATYIYKTGLRYIYTAAILGLLALFLSLNIVSYVFLLLALSLIWFFRNPERKVLKTRDDQILAPADGVIIKMLEDVVPKGYEDIKQKWQQVSIFMRVYDVHVNRIPFSGEVKRIIYNPGKFKYAAVDQADVDNERLSILIEGKKFSVVCQQVAGMLARRIISHVKKGDKVEAGERYGFIQMGSRMDIYLPSHLKISVKKGDKVQGGLHYIVE